MGRFRLSGGRFAITLLCLVSIAGCGGGKKGGTPIYAGKININPTVNTSLALGGTLVFTASVQSTSGTTIATPVSYTSSDTSILNIAPGGVACAGHWDAAFTTCTPGAVGVATVTASALNASSTPTLVYVHPPIDSITVTGILLNGLPVQEPCLSQTQTMTLEAHAFSQGADVTASVGPFTWSANNISVVTLTPLTTQVVYQNFTYTVATNQATAKAATPGITNIYASASGVSSNSFQQPTLTNAAGAGSPVLDFFATCPIANISLTMGTAGSNQTSFVASKSGSTAETVIATLTDIMGNSSLPNTNGEVILNKVPLTWTSSQPQVLGTSSSCSLTCALSVLSPGAATVTASCTPPLCNAGYPLIPDTFLTNGQLDQTKIASCTSYFQAMFPQLVSCQQVIPEPVYSSPVFVTPPSLVGVPLTPSASISGLVTGAATGTSVLATSTDCASEAPVNCTTSIYYPSTAAASVGSEIPVPVAPNSLLFDLPGDKIFMGSQYGAEIVNPASLGSSSNPFTSLGTVTGKVLAASATGTVAVFADTIDTPNQVYIESSAAGTTGPAITALPISSATTAATSPDNLKTLIVGGTSGTSLYIYSAQQALQGPVTLAGAASQIAFSPNGAFAYISESINGAASANVTAFATCNNAQMASVNLPANPILMKVLPNLHMDGTDSYGNLIPDGVHILILDATGFDIVTSTISAPATGTLCPQGITFVSGDPLRSVQRIELGQNIQPPPAYSNFFASPDASQLYVVTAASSSVFVYNFTTGSLISGIELLNHAAPVSADMTVDGGTIMVAGSDGELHELNTGSFADVKDLTFPNLPNYLNPFCTFTPSTGPCTFTTVLVRP